MIRQSFARDCHNENAQIEAKKQSVFARDLDALGLIDWSRKRKSAAALAG
jgi:hypothetical protein